jgi:hypothetical protein
MSAEFIDTNILSYVMQAARTAASAPLRLGQGAPNQSPGARETVRCRPRARLPATYWVPLLALTPPPSSRLNSIF